MLWSHVSCVLLDNDNEMLACHLVDIPSLQCQSLTVWVEYGGTVETSLYLSFSVKILLLAF